MKPITDPQEHAHLAHDIMKSHSWDEAAKKLERYKSRVEMPYVEALNEIKRIFVGKRVLKHEDIVKLLEDVGLADDDVIRVQKELEDFQKSCDEDFP